MDMGLIWLGMYATLLGQAHMVLLIPWLGAEEVTKPHHPYDNDAREPLVYVVKARFSL